MAFFHSTIIMLYFISFLQESCAKFFEIKSLSSGKYFVIFDNGIFIYDVNFKQLKVLQNFNRILSNSDRIIIKDHIFNEKIYIFGIINNYLYIYDDSKEIIIMNSIDNKLLNYRYYDILPYNTKENKLNFILKSIIFKSQEQNCGYKQKCTYYYYFIILSDYNINYEQNNLKITFLQTQNINADPSIFQEKKISAIF